MTLYIINGPNLNMLGVREPSHYGTTDYKTLCKKLRSHAKARGVRVRLYQSNHEGALVDEIQRAYRHGATGIIINPGAYTHTSIALLDAIKSTSLPTVEVHISDLSRREEFRQTSFIRLAAEHSIIGHGIDGYLEAIDYFIHKHSN